MEMRVREATKGETVYIYISTFSFSKDCIWDVHIKKATRKGKVRMGKLDPKFANRNLDVRIETKPLKSIITAPLEYAGKVWGENQKVIQ